MIPFSYKYDNSSSEESRIFLLLQFYCNKNVPGIIEYVDSNLLLFTSDANQKL